MKLKTRLWANLMSDVDSFDHQFFKTTKREAAALDPHQRLLLQATYHVLESAGWLSGNTPEVNNDCKEGPGHSTACFIGMNAPDWPLNLASNPVSPFTGGGMLRSFVAGRLSYHFRGTGPSHTIDTAYSSPMVAVHQACSSLQLEECTRAVAGGTNLITNLALCRRLFRGEAVGVVVLQPLPTALADKDDIHGVILATGNNQNMKGTTITNPVLESQAGLYCHVLKRAGFAKGMSYVEAHGIGTRAGDPVEMGAISQILGEGRRATTLHVDSLKANIGHSEGTSGVIPLIKVLLMMRHGMITPQADFRDLNPDIQPLELDGPVISMTHQDWTDRRRLALVNSYGASGNNAVAVVAPPPSPSTSTRMVSGQSASGARRQAAIASPKFPFVISAASYTSLTSHLKRLNSQIQDGAITSPIHDVAFTLATKRNRQRQHLFCTTAESSPQPVVLLFSGQNGNTVPSIPTLYNSSEPFQKHLNECNEAIELLNLPSLFPAVLQGLQGESDLILLHTAMFAIQCSSVCGHSFGEWAAATVSGVMTLKEGMKVVTGDRGQDQGLNVFVPVGGKDPTAYLAEVKVDVFGSEQQEATLDDLGADSLNGPEIAANLSNRFNARISMDDFAKATDVASLCALVSMISQDGDLEASHALRLSDQVMHRICEILRDSLGLELSDIKPDSKLEDLGIDSFVSVEIIGNLKEAFNTDITSSEFASATDLASVYQLVTGLLSSSRSSSTSPGLSTPDASANNGSESFHNAFLQVRGSFDYHANDTKFTGYWDLAYPQQLSVVAVFIIEAFEKLVCALWRYKEEEKLSDLGAILPKYQRELTRLWDILAEAGVVEKSSLASAYDLDALLGSYLAEYLTGQTDSITTLFSSNAGCALLEDFYANGPDLRATTQILCDLIEAAIRINAMTGSDGELFRVLEATGLPFTYTFTGVSVSLVARAKKSPLFRSVPEMDFYKLDIEEAPPANLLGCYHLFISSNCLHAPRDLKSSLLHIRQLLRPRDGCLALVELTQKQAWYDLVWSFLDGWWLFDDGGTYALQSPWAWERYMRDAGFSHVDWSEGVSRESRGVCVICGLVADLDQPCPIQATSMLLRNPILFLTHPRIVAITSSWSLLAVGLAPSSTLSPLG
ncbi:polyketide synthase [Fusarium subglutinans]|uniref:Polyketide synthase n=1 Tax=Gibberella subglutinans TaxID=42677 RepID=A0A8H5KQM2_GIBSU|nr:polyketide synthase [Fusarium subglutinans]KAF5578714.1 polyketide synthase [Fusarium subglutinans]